MVGSSSPGMVADSLSSCNLPPSTTVTQVVDFPNNQPASAVQSTLSVTLPSSNRYASVLAGQVSSKKERFTDYECLFSYAPTTPVKVTQEGQTTSFTIQTDYLAPGILQSPTVTSDGLEFSAPIYVTSSEFSIYPVGTHVTLEVNAPGRQIMYSQPPLTRGNGALIWKWALVPSPQLNLYPPPPPFDIENGLLAWESMLVTRAQVSPNPKGVNITVPLGPGEHITAFLQYTHGVSVFRSVNFYNIDLFFSPAGLIGWLGYVAAALSLLFALRWYGPTIKFRWRALACSLLLPIVPILGSFDISWQFWSLPISAIFAIGCILLTGIFLFRVLRSPLLRDRQPVLRGRAASVAAWLPLVLLPPVATVLALIIGQSSAIPDDFTPRKLSDATWGLWSIRANIIVSAILIWLVGWLVLALARSSLRAVSVWANPDGSLRDTGGVGVVVARWYQLAVGVLAIVSAYGVGYALANPFGQAAVAYRDSISSAESASSYFAGQIGSQAIYPVLFLLLPVAATLTAAIVNSTMPSSVLTVKVVAVATLAWAIASRVLDFDIVGTNLPVGAWILAAIVTVSLRKPLRDSGANGNDKPWLPVRKTPQPDSPLPMTLRIRLGRWLTKQQPVESEKESKDLPPPGSLVQRGPFRDVRSRANVSLAWATLLSVVPVAYLIWGTLTTLPKYSTQPINTSYVLSQIVAEIVRWVLTGWLYGLLVPVLPGRVGPVKALWLSGAWFAASVPIVILDGWTGANPGRGWLFPGLQLLLFLTALAVLVDLSTVHAWMGGRTSLMESWTTLLEVYNFEGVRKVALYAAPAAAAVIAVGQQVVTGTSLDFVNSLLSQLPGLLGGK